MIEEADLDGNG
jgi:calmodulin